MRTIENNFSNRIYFDIPNSMEQGDMDNSLVQMWTNWLIRVFEKETYPVNETDWIAFESWLSRTEPPPPEKRWVRLSG